MDALPKKSEHDSRKLNLLFYRNRYKINGEGETIDQILDWRGNYHVLEARHDYIQWLFPTSQPSIFNARARSLTLGEAAEMSRCDDVMTRFHKALNMILDFWGFVMKDSPIIIKPKANFAQRRRWIGTHNDLRVSRVLMCAAELGVYRIALAFGACLVWLVCTDHHSHRATCQDYWLGNIRATLHKHKAICAAQESTYAITDDGRDVLQEAVPCQGRQVEPGMESGGTEATTSTTAGDVAVVAAGEVMDATKDTQPAAASTPSAPSVPSMPSVLSFTHEHEDATATGSDGSLAEDTGRDATTQEQEAVGARCEPPAQGCSEDKGVKIQPENMGVTVELCRERAGTCGSSSPPSLACSALPLLDMPLEEVDRVLARLERACKTGKAIPFQDLWSTSQKK